MSYLDLLYRQRVRGVLITPVGDPSQGLLELREHGTSRSTRPTAVFCPNDQLALGVLQRFTERRVPVPGDIAIVGYDDIDFAAAAAVRDSSRTDQESRSPAVQRQLA